ncbi:MAG: hypothetical protein LBM74_08960 [Oscillospiraceae bacterium]|jgi:ESS family glutamate:Na+ symporter|nr:hypothetical protein [Oscillospiraceae bacterium]
MDFSQANTGLWGFMVQMGILCATLLVANLLVRKLPLIRKTLLPTAVLAGLLLLILKSIGLLNVRTDVLEMITYHGIAIGFIAMSMRVTAKADSGKSATGAKSGALIVSCYVLQGIMGLLITLLLSYTFMPGLFQAAGILLPMGYGQGPGQANNVGSTYEALGFLGGRSFGLSIAAAGFISACVVGVIYLNLLNRRGLLRRGDGARPSGSVTIDTFQDADEIPISESVDRLSVNLGLVMVVYLMTYLTIWGLSSLAGLLGSGIGGTVSTLLWGFNFIVGSMLALALRALLKSLRKAGIMHRQYQNNYLLSRISGLAFDLMIVAGIASIEISDLQGLWAPFLLMSVAGAIGTLIYLKWICKKLYPGYYYEGLLSMYGMMTGTISSGILPLREIDPDFATPAANNLIAGSSFAVLFGAPMLALIGIAPGSAGMTWLTLGLLAVYLVPLVLFMLRFRKGK